MPPAARITDMHTCPMVNPGPVPHVGGPIIKGQPNVLTLNLPQARVSDQCICVGPPDIIAKGSMTVLCGGLPAARMGDNTAHGGVIVTGAPTVLIGDGSNGGGGGGGSSAAMPGNVPFSAPNLQSKTMIAAHKEAKPFCAICESGGDKAAKEKTVQKSKSNTAGGPATKQTVNNYQVDQNAGLPKAGSKTFKRIHKDGNLADPYTLQSDGKPMGAETGQIPTESKGLKGLPKNYHQKRREGWPDLDYKGGETFKTFSEVEAVNLKPGTKIYRIVDESAGDAGGFWAYDLPKNKTKWRSDFAVKDGWNDNGYFVEHTVGNDGMKVWSGKAAAQKYKGGKFYLPGQGEQIFVTPGATNPTPPKLTSWPEG